MPETKGETKKNSKQTKAEGMFVDGDFVQTMVAAAAVMRGMLRGFRVRHSQGKCCGQEERQRS